MQAARKTPINLLLLSIRVGSIATAMIASMLFVRLYNEPIDIYYNLHIFNATFIIHTLTFGKPDINIDYNQNNMEGRIFYITKAKLHELQKEYDELLEFEKQKTVGQEAPKVLESEDMNPEFISFQEDMGFLRSRIDELKNILEHHEMIKNPPKDRQGIIGVGASVKIGINGEKDEFVIVGTLEANPALGKISNESPVGKALLGHKVGDEVIIPSPVKTTYKIKGIKYEIN